MSTPSNPTALSAEALAHGINNYIDGADTPEWEAVEPMFRQAASLILALDAALDRAVQEIELIHESSVYARSGNAKYAESCGKTYASQFAIDAAATPPTKAASGS